ncbi:hypothetical protein EB118_06975 [bacterium]|nr:hypothetical protein [bacterium]NDC94387.1 hypothetical protein [bacterium]NDD83928.1 hypothetical protein [bacterium]NDG29823.1 hypothetical protein [bacterium]
MLLGIIYNFIMGLMSENADQIIDRLWVGNYKSPLDISFLRQNNIQVIVNCTPDVPFHTDVYSPDQIADLKIETFRIPVYDSLLEKDILLMEEYLKLVIPFLIRKYVIEKKNILINCVAGAQRSAIVCAALLNVLVERGIVDIPGVRVEADKSKQFKKIREYMLSRRPRVFLYGASVNFDKSYRRFFNY